MGTRKNDKHQLITRTCTNQTTSWFVHNWSTFGARTSHGQLRTQKTHHGLDLGEITTFPLIVYSMPGHKSRTQMAFCLGTPEIPKVRTFATLGAHNFVCRPSIEMTSKQSCRPCQELSNNMWHATCTQGNWGNSQLLVVGSQTANLTPNPSFGHNLCFKCPNGSCEPILNI
jgi:hypothetical protein